MPGIAHVTIQIADGSYAGPVALRRWLGAAAVHPGQQCHAGQCGRLVVECCGHRQRRQSAMDRARSQGDDHRRARHLCDHAIKFGNFAVSGGAQSLAQGSAGQVIFNGRTVTFSGTVAYSAGTITTNRSGGNVDCYGMTFVNGGIVTEPRYTANGNGTVTVAGTASTFLPGTSAGSAATGGQYW